MKFNVGLIGLGKIGASYDVHTSGPTTMTHLNAIIKDGRFNLSFAYDPCKSTCDAIKQYYGIQNVFHRFTDVRDANLQADLLVVACPTNAHLESIELSLQFLKPKIILCEKPLAGSLTDGYRIAKLCRENRIDIVTNFMRRSLPLFAEIKEKIIGQFPSKQDVIVKYSGCFRNNGSHFIDLMTYFYGEPVGLVSSLVEKNDQFQLKARAVVGHKCAICTYIPLISASVVDHEVEIMSDKFKIVIGRAGRDITVYEVLEDADFSGILMYGAATRFNSDYLNFQKYVYDDIYLALESGNVPPNLCGIESSLGNIKLIQDIISYDD